jgi:hypothetical protein
MEERVQLAKDQATPAFGQLREWTTDEFRTIFETELKFQEKITGEPIHPNSSLVSTTEESKEGNSKQNNSRRSSSGRKSVSREDTAPIDHSNIYSAAAYQGKSRDKQRNTKSKYRERSQSRGSSSDGKRPFSSLKKGQDKPPKEDCYLCEKGKHWMKDCKTYKSAHERIAQANRKNICIYCLSRKHIPTACDHKRACYYCQAMHHQVFCPKQFPNEKAASWCVNEINQGFLYPIFNNDNWDSTAAHQGEQYEYNPDYSPEELEQMQRPDFMIETMQVSLTLSIKMSQTTLTNLMMKVFTAALTIIL